MATRYRKALNSPHLLELREEIALTVARVVELLGRLDTGEAGALWRRLQDAYADLTAARIAGDTAREAEALATLGQLITLGLADTAAWAEIGRQIDRKQRLVESERRRMVELHQMIRVDELMTLVAALTEAVKRHVSDRATLGAISADFSKLLEQNTGSNGQHE